MKPRSFLGSGLSYLALGLILGILYLTFGWRILAFVGGGVAGIGALLALAGLYFRWQGWE
jgi:hypothetical protein